MKQCRCQYTIKVTEGNEWDLLLQLKTDTYESDQPISGDIDFRALEDVVTTIDGIEWQHTIEDNGVMLHIPAEEPEGWQGQPWRGPHNVELTATYFGVEIRAAYFECFTIVKWSYESNVRNFIPEAPQASELAFVYVGITDDEELEALKQQYREAIAATETARLEYEAAKEELEEKAESLDDVAQQTTLVEGIASVLQGFAPLATTAQLTTVAQDILTAISHIDIDTTTLAKEQTLTNGIQSILTALNPKATTADVTAAKQAILDALSHISPEDPYSKALAQFFGLPEALPEYTAMTDSQIKQICDEDWVALYGYLTVEVTMHFLDANNQDQTVHIYVRPDQTYAAQGWSNLYTAYTGGSSLDQTQPTANQTVYFVR